jgi:hypothetical protein
MSRVVARKYLLVALVVAVLAGGAGLGGRRLRIGLVPRAAAATAPAPVEYHPYRSKVLPYTIAYPPGWKAGGSLWGTAKRPLGEWWVGDYFSKKGVGSIIVEAETLPPGSLLTSESYEETQLLDLERAQESESSEAYIAQRMGTLKVDGITAYVLDFTVGKGSDALETTAVLWVDKGRGWRAGLTTAQPGQAHATEVPALKSMATTFHDTGVARAV